MKQLFCILFSFLFFCPQHLRPADVEGDSIDTEKTVLLSPEEYKASLKNFILPVSLITVGVIASHSENKDIFSFDRTDYKSEENPWDYVFLGGVACSIFAFDQWVEAKHKPLDQSMLLFLSAGLSLVPAYVIKENSTEQRPDGGWNSFPSGHTTTAFMIAHLFNKEFKDSNLWLAYGGYAIATGIAISRVTRNNHWVCDVVAGAGIGILGTELAYFIYFRYLSNLTNQLFGKNASIAPIAGNDVLGMNLNISF